MAPTTEAACLLQSGSMYPARVGLRDADGGDVFFGVKSGGFSLYHGDEPIYHFDFEGRWLRAYIEGVHYLKGLDASVRAIERGREGQGLVLRRRILEPPEVVEIDETIRRGAEDLIGGIRSNLLSPVSPPSAARTIELGELMGFLERVARWDAPAWQAHRDRYEATYGPWPFLPPDCPSPVVLQATGGQAFGLGRSQETPARSVEEFRGHAQEVSALLGRRVSQCRDVFLAGADVLRHSVEQILGYLETIGSCFSLLLESPRLGAEAPRAGGVHAFLDDFRPALPDLEGWHRLKAARLGRVTLGVESGDPSIRRNHGKSWEDEGLRETVDHLKAAGIGVGLVVLIGSAGRDMAGADLEATARLIGSLPLVEGDLISLVDARSVGLASKISDPLTDEETAGQQAGLKKRLIGSRSSKGPRVFPYHPDKQWS